MDYEDMIKEEPKPEAELLEPEVEPDPVEPRAKSPWKAFILTGLLAGLIGAGGGGYGAYAALKKFSPAPAAQAAVDLSPIETRLKRLTDRVTAAEATAKDTANRPSVESEPVDLSGIEDRLKALETAPSPEIDPVALTALQTAQKDGFEWPDTSALEDRIAALETDVETVRDAGSASGLDDETLTELETRVMALEDRPISATSAVDAKKLTALTARLKALESRSAPTSKVERVSILAFPKARMIAAAENNVEGGLLKKTLSQHIRVKSANDPFTLITGIETDISEGRLAAAVKKFERLPPPIREVGQAWYESVKASL